MTRSSLLPLPLVVVMLAPVLVQAAPDPGTPPEQLSVFVDLVVEGRNGQPLLNLTREEVLLLQDGVQQRLISLRALETPGHYELSYVPASGAPPNSISVRVLRPGANPHGPAGALLQPRAVRPLATLGRDLVQLLRSRPDANDFPSFPGALRFENDSRGIHHTLALEVPLHQLATDPARLYVPRRLQLLALLSDDRGRHLQAFEVEQPPTIALTLVWTTQVHLPPGRYRLDTIARDADTGRLSVRRFEWQAHRPAAGPRASSVVLLLPEGGRRFAQGLAEDDPLLERGTALIPTFNVRTVAQAGVTIPLLVDGYRDPSLPEALELRLSLLRGEELLASAPLPVPPPDAAGATRYTGRLDVSRLPQGEYLLRVMASQGSLASAEEARFSITTETPTPVRIPASRP